MKIKVTDIIIPEWKHENDESNVSELVKSIKTVGLLNSPIINKNNNLIAGRDRIEAIKHLKFDKIDCIVLNHDELLSELAGLDENLIRKVPDPVARVRAIKRREQILEILGLRKKPHGDGSNQHKSKAAETAALHTNKTIASSMSMSEKTYRKNKQIGKSINDGVLVTLAGTKVTMNDLEKIACLDHKQQAVFAKKLKNHEVKDFNDFRLFLARTKHTAQSVASTKPNPPCLYIGDGIKWIESQEPCDLLLTDPPYSTDVENIEVFVQEWLPVALAKVKPTGCGYIFVGAYPNELKAYLNVETPGHLTLTNVLVWHYKNTLGVTPKNKYNLDWQAILYYRGKKAPPINSPLTAEQRAVQEVNAPGGFGSDGIRYHPWQKPDELAERFIRHSTKPGDVVLDPFACTGTFLVAASKLGRIGKGAEINPNNAKIALERGCAVDQI